MPSIDNLFGIHASALKLREQRMSMLASNIANAATPGYKARDIDFSSALKIAESGQSPEAAIRYRIPVQPSLDGNTVELATEQTAFAEMRSRTGHAFPSSTAASPRQRWHRSTSPHAST